eukprot:6242033-Amphidinium_carterae.1
MLCIMRHTPSIWMTHAHTNPRLTNIQGHCSDDKQTIKQGPTQKPFFFNKQKQGNVQKHQGHTTCNDKGLVQLERTIVEWNGINVGVSAYSAQGPRPPRARATASKTPEV